MVAVEITITHNVTLPGEGGSIHFPLPTNPQRKIHLMNKNICLVLIVAVLSVIPTIAVAATYTPTQIMSAIKPYMISSNAINQGSPMQTSYGGGQVYIYKLPTNPATYVYTSSGAIDCDGQATIHCTGTTDSLYQGQTSFTQSDGRPLNAELLPWYVLPETPNSIFDYANRKIYGGEAGLVLYNGKMEFGVFGDERGRDSGNSAGLAIGEISYSMASALGIDPDPDYGGIEIGVTYVVFTTEDNVIVPIENHMAAETKGQSALNKMMTQLSPAVTLTPAPAPITNLLKNPGFESGSTRPNNWWLATMYSNTPILSTVHHSGNRSVKVYISGTTNKISGDAVSDHLPSTSYKIYNLSAWGKGYSLGGNAPAVRLAEYDVNHRWLRNTPVYFPKGTYGWTKKQRTIKTGVNTAYVSVYANIYNGYGTFWVDDVTLKAS